MACDKKTIPEFTKAQVAECEKCRHASEKKIWCCLLGVWIKEPQKIIQPNKKLALPSKRKMAGSFIKEGAKYLKAGRPKRTPAEQAVCMALCEACEFYIAESKLGPRCGKCGCCVSLATRWATKHCPLKKW
jgi:hypothetical protein